MLVNTSLIKKAKQMRKKESLLSHTMSDGCLSSDTPRINLHQSSLTTRFDTPVVPSTDTTMRKRDIKVVKKRTER